MGKSVPLAIFWFRRDLRLEDNCGFSQALQKHSYVLPIFIFDRTILDPLKDRADRRVDFIHRRLNQLRETLQQHGSALWTFFGTPQQAFKQLVETFSIEAVYANSDYEPDAIKRDHGIGRFLKTFGIPFFGYKDQVIFAENDILTATNQPYKVYTPFKRKWLATLTPMHVETYATAPLFKKLFPSPTPFPLPSLESMGFQPTGLSVPGLTVDETLIRDYHLQRDIPALDATSHLGIHLRFGTISIRALVRLAQQLNQTWLSELIWREFFMQILFHFPQVVTQSFRPEYDQISWRNEPEEFARWCHGQTGYPLVDAGMRELNETGFMHNRVRMVVASFLCKHLLTHWRFGEAYFAEKLLDFDLSANNGNWQWAAGTGCDAAPYFRVFNPEAQMKKFDPDHTYVRRWVPEWQTPAYPEPMVEHKLARQRAIDTYKKGLEFARNISNLKT